MKKVLFVVVAMLVISTPVFAYHDFETVSDAQDRHQAEHYEQRQANGGNEPLGGYSDKLGDSSGRSN